MHPHAQWSMSALAAILICLTSAVVADVHTSLERTVKLHLRIGEFELPVQHDG